MAAMPGVATGTSAVVDRFLTEPAPFLPILHAIQEENGYLPKAALSEVSEALHIPMAELFGTVSFYHYFRLAPPEKGAPAPLCGGPACVLKERLPEGAESISCPGRCDTPVARFARGTFEPLECALPPRTDAAECLFEHIREGKPWIQDYGNRGGYEALKQAPEAIIEALKKSGLAGRGGAGFPTGVKWEAVRNAAGDPKYIICNADEGEPGCFKDRVLMNHDPHAVLEGMAAAGRATGATVGIIYLRYEYPDSLQPLQRAIDEATRDDVLGDFKIHIRRGAGAYICGEETSMLNSLEGVMPFPRDKPPYPTTHGLFQKPTVINNVETFAAVPPILRNGADWYQGIGLGENAGTKIFSVSGDVTRPGNYELPLGTPLRELLELAGSADVKAVTMAGISGGFLGGKDLDIALDIPSVKKAGSMLGAGGVIVYNASRCMVRAAADCMRFFADESCGKCFPCRIGTTRITERLTEPGPGAIEEIDEIGRVMASTSACGLGLAAPLVTVSLMKYWPDEVKAHVTGRCTTGACR